MPAVQQRGTITRYPSYRDPVGESVCLPGDGDLIQQALAGNQDAFETLVERYRGSALPFYCPLFRRL